jgi:tetratricopeptide (TPR) repeat protein
MDEALGDDVRAVPPEPRVFNRNMILGAAAGVTLITAVLAMLLIGRKSEMEKGIDAFRDERYAIAEQHFRTALGSNGNNVTARLYLARMLRSQGRNQEVAELLKGAVGTAPRDPAVRRELGHLFLDLDQPALAIEHFRLAVEEQPDEDLNWVGLIEALYRAQDPSADEWLERAPPTVQAMIRTGRR